MGWPMNIRPVRVGELITASLMNEIIDVANRCNLTVSQGGGLNMTAGPGGYTLSAVIPRPIYGRITGPLASGTYPFQQQWPDDSGTWMDAPLTDVAFEQNANPSVPTGKVVTLERTSSGSWIFEYGAC